MKEIPLRTLLDSGLLFEINRRVLHPLGLALALHWDDDSGEGEPQSVKLLATDDPDGVIFTAGTFVEGERKLRDFMENIGLNKVTTRRSLLRFVEQESPDQGLDTVRPPPP